MRFFRLSFIIYILLFTFIVLTNAHAQTKLAIQFKGIKSELLSNTQARLTILKKSYGQLTENKIHAFFSQAPQEIRQALQPYGYFKPNIHAQLIQNKSQWVSIFTIQLGQPIKISQLDIKVLGSGKDNAAIKKFIHQFPIQIGDIFQSEVYKKTKENLLQITNNQGYIKAYYAQNQIFINIAQQTAKVIIHLNTGPLYYFGHIYFSKSPYSKAFLKRFVYSLVNQPFSSEKLLQLQQQMSASYYFQQIVVIPQFNNLEKNNHIPIKMEVSVPKAKKYNLGIGYGTFSGPRLTAGISLRRLNDSGQHFDAQFKMSSVLSGVSAKYYIPGRHPLTDQWVTGFNYQRFLPKNGSSTSNSIEAGYLTKTAHSETHASLNYLMENFKIKSMPGEKIQLLYPSLNFNYSVSNDAISPTQGKSINITLRGASKNMLSYATFFQAQLKAKYLFSPFDFSHIILRTDLGYSITKNLNEIPLSMRFFAGGLNSIRGYPDSSIGPGRYLYTVSTEYQNHLINNWWAAIFYDGGTATNHYFSTFYQSVGLGIVYQSAIGPIKLYFARTLHQPKNHSAIELSIGPEF